MISALTGKLKRVDDDRVFLEAGPMQFELLVPAADVTELQASLGETLTLHTIFMLAGDPSRGGLEPTLIAFLRPEDRQFFELFTTVKGIGAGFLLALFAVNLLLVGGALGLAVALDWSAWVSALATGGALLAAGIVAAFVGWSKRVKTPLEATRRTLKQDWRWAKNRVA